jgi:hypothetical protein
LSCHSCRLRMHASERARRCGSRSTRMSCSTCSGRTGRPTRWWRCVCSRHDATLAPVTASLDDTEAFVCSSLSQDVIIMNDATFSRVSPQEGASTRAPGAGALRVLTISFTRPGEHGPGEGQGVPAAVQRGLLEAVLLLDAGKWSESWRSAPTHV